MQRERAVADIGAAAAVAATARFSVPSYSMGCEYKNS